MLITCAAMILGVSLQDLPDFALRLEAEARTLTAQTEITPDFTSRVNTFSADAEQLSVALSDAGVAEDLPSVLHGIAQDAHQRATELHNAHTTAQRATAMNDLHTLLSDTMLIAPMAASAAADRVAAANPPTETASR